MRKSLIIIPVGLVVLLAACVLAYTKVIAGDPPKRLAFTDTSTTAGAGAATPATNSASAGTAPASVDGAWAPTAASQAGYRAKEILFGQSVTAVGRTHAVTGQMVIAGTTVSTASFTIDLTKVKSDSDQRDRQFQGRIMNTSQFPSAEFVLSKPITVGALPADKTETAVQATGKLTLKGKTNEVTFELKARRNGANIEVNGTIPVTFADYGIGNPSAGPAQVGDNGEVEVLLVFAKKA